ncbi:hypothetical protein ACOSQ2_024914 [Xanthoceras sorbifolium]
MCAVSGNSQNLIDTNLTSFYWAREAYRSSSYNGQCRVNGEIVFWHLIQNGGSKIQISRKRSDRLVGTHKSGGTEIDELGGRWGCGGPKGPEEWYGLVAHLHCNEVIGLVGVKDLVDETEKVMEGSSLEKLKAIDEKIDVGKSKGKLMLKDVEIESDVSKAEDIVIFGHETVMDSKSYGVGLCCHSLDTGQRDIRASSGELSLVQVEDCSKVCSSKQRK